VFDAVGTLIRPVESISAVYHRLAIQHGSRLDRSTVKARFRVARSRFFSNEPQQPCSDPQEKASWFRLVRSVFQDQELDSVDNLFQDLWSYYAAAENWMTFADVPQTLEVLSQQGHQLAIASNFDSRLIPICQALPPLQRISSIFCSGQLGYRKPDKRFFETVETLLRKNGIASATTRRAALPGIPLMVGDDYVKDVLAAQSAGWQSLHLDRSTGGLADLIIGLVQ